MPWILVIFVLAILETLPLDVACARLADIYWNATNPIFRIDNTDHIIDVNKGNIPFEYDQVNIICPVYSPGTRDEDVERYIIYNVSKEEYDSCRITNPHSRIIAICDKPQQLMYFTITFRSFTPQPGGLEFRPGQDYYFISTSSGRMAGLDQRIGGRCATHNMKVIFKVCCDPSKTSSTTTTTTSSTTTTTTTTQKSTTATATTAAVSTAKSTLPTFPPRFPPVASSKLPPMKTYDMPWDEDKGKTPSKKTEDRDKIPNQTRAKNEELVNNNNGSSSSKSPISGSMLVSSVILLLLILLSR